MKFFIDTANINEIKEAHSMGMADGVTTNPSLIAREGRKLETVIGEICDVVDGPVSAEVISTEFGGMVEEARKPLEVTIRLQYTPLATVLPSLVMPSQVMPYAC